jgi:hypothetical protein
MNKKETASLLGGALTVTMLRRQKTKGAFMRIAIFVLLSVFLMGSLLFSQTGGTLKTKNGLLELTLPPGWTQTPGKEFLMIQNADDKAYGIFAAEDRRDFYGLNLEKYAFVRAYQLIEDLTFLSLPCPKSLTISGKPAIQYEFSGVQSATKTSYVLTVIEAENTFLSITGWTGTSNLDNVRKELSETLPQAAKEVSIK